MPNASQTTINLEMVLIVLREHFPNLMAAYIFGSFATGMATDESDIDLAILMEGYAEPLDLWDVAADLANALQRDVDLIDLRMASTVLQYQVLTLGRRFWAGSSAVDVFECFVLSEKTALDTARAPLLADLAATGRVYG